MKNLEHILLNTLCKEGWGIVGIHHHHGFDVFLNGLRTATSGGIGEYLDLIPLIDWCKKLGMDVIQLLPLNDSGLDPSPYNAISSCALNPIFLKLSALPYLDTLPALSDKIEMLYEYNIMPITAYQEVLKEKMDWLRQYIEEVAPHIEKEQEYQHFQAAFPWIESYSLFKTLLLKFDYASWETWPNEYRQPTPEKRCELNETYTNEIAFHTILQYLCFQQLIHVKEHAEKHHVFLKGDLPILISRNSSDVWQDPQFFDLLHTAGAPPDQYSTEGQNWGFPLFNWDAMRQDNYRFWKERLQAAGNFYHLYRIDHTVGFFRIWGIPLNHPSRDGHFFPSEPSQYLPQGSHILSMLAASSTMLPIAEDLGTVPPEVRICLKELGIPGTRVMRWELDWTKPPPQPFIPLKEYWPLSMTCVSTHDSETLGGWWKSHSQDAARWAHHKHWHYSPELSHEHRKSYLRDSHHTSSLFHVNLLQEYLALYPELIAANPDEERINVPGTISPNNWTYRYRPTVETIVSHKGLLSDIRSLVGI